MEIVHVEAKELGTVAEKIPSTTAGLTSAYQKTGNATLGASAVATTGGDILIEMAVLPLFEADVDIIVDDLGAMDKDEAAEGYKAMATENSLLAEQLLPLALESWPAWKE